VHSFLYDIFAPRGYLNPECSFYKNASLPLHKAVGLYDLEKPLWIVNANLAANIRSNIEEVLELYSIHDPAAEAFLRFA